MFCIFGRSASLTTVFFTIWGPTRDKMLIYTLLDYRVTNQIYLATTRKTSSAELEIDKSDLSFCNQAVQNLEINISSRFSPMLVCLHVVCIKTIHNNCKVYSTVLVRVVIV